MYVYYEFQSSNFVVILFVWQLVAVLVYSIEWVSHLCSFEWIRITLLFRTNTCILPRCHLSYLVYDIVLQ